MLAMVFVLGMFFTFGSLFIAFLVYVFGWLLTCIILGMVFLLTMWVMGFFKKVNEAISTIKENIEETDASKNEERIWDLIFVIPFFFGLISDRLCLHLVESESGADDPWTGQVAHITTYMDKCLEKMEKKMEKKFLERMDKMEERFESILKRQTAQNEVGQADLRTSQMGKRIV